MTVTLLVRLQGVPGSGGTLRVLIGSMPPENDIPGCLGWEVFTNNENPDEILLLERWQSIAAHVAHLESIAASKEFTEISAHVAKADRAYFAPLQSGGPL